MIDCLDLFGLVVFCIVVAAGAVGVGALMGWVIDRLPRRRDE